MKKYKKVNIKGHQSLDLYPVYSNSVYNGHEPLKIVGIRKYEIELEGDYSGGTHGVNQKQWHNINECFLVKEVCEETQKPFGCQVHNIYCCGGGSVISKHVDKYWENLIEQS